MAPDKAKQQGGRPEPLTNEHGRQPKRRLHVGVGRAMAHHGELLQGVFEGEEGRLHRGLVTLPMPDWQSLVTFWPKGEGGIGSRPTNRTKAARAAALALAYLGYDDASGDLTVESDIPVGHGYGSSTADVIAAIRAVAAATGATLRRSTVSRLAAEAEGASDAIAYGDQAVLFSHREGRILEHFGGEFPPFIVVGFQTQGSAINTLDLPRARYDPREIGLFRTLRGLTYRAVRLQDPKLMGHVASASARINQHHLAKSKFTAFVTLAEDYDACGVQVAHSGSLLGVLFDANERGVVTRAAALAGKIKAVGFQGVRLFSVNADGSLAEDYRNER